MVVYIASSSPLPLIPWREDHPAFNVTNLSEFERPVCHHFRLPNVRQAGSHTSCGCGFNEGRQHPECYDDPASEQRDSLKSSSSLVRYIREHKVEQIYSCWSGDEGETKEFERSVTLNQLLAPEFFFRERELLAITQPSSGGGS